jgi:hypothetical protein
MQNEREVRMTSVASAQSRVGLRPALEQLIETSVGALCRELLKARPPCYDAVYPGTGGPVESTTLSMLDSLDSMRRYARFNVARAP